MKKLFLMLLSGFGSGVRYGQYAAAVHVRPLCVLGGGDTDGFARC